MATKLERDVLRSHRRIATTQMVARDGVVTSGDHPEREAARASASAVARAIGTSNWLFITRQSQ
jgi:hypothetical protein